MINTPSLSTHLTQRSCARRSILPRAVRAAAVPAIHPLDQEQPLPEPAVPRAAPLQGGGGGGLGGVRDARAVLLLAAGGDEDSAAGEGAGRDAAEDDSVHIWWTWRERVMGREGGIWNQAVHVGIDADESG